MLFNHGSRPSNAIYLDPSDDVGCELQVFIDFFYFELILIKTIDLIIHNMQVYIQYVLYPKYSY
jgi:hypothetical protein